MEKLSFTFFLLNISVGSVVPYRILYLVKMFSKEIVNKSTFLSHAFQMTAK